MEGGFTLSDVDIRRVKHSRLILNRPSADVQTLWKLAGLCVLVFFHEVFHVVFNRLKCNLKFTSQLRMHQMVALFMTINKNPKIYCEKQCSESEQAVALRPTEPAGTMFLYPFFLENSSNVRQIVSTRT